MRNNLKLLAVCLLAVIQVASPQAVIAAAPAPLKAADVTAPISIHFAPTASGPLVVESVPAPNFEAEVLDPLRAQQAALAATQKVAVKKAKVIKPTKPATAAPDHGQAAPTPENWLKLKYCESGNNYANKRNPSYRGAYQFSFSTWGNYGGYHDPADAPPAVQDAKAQATFNSSGWRPWGCAYQLGFI